MSRPVLAQYSLGQLRSFADCRVISSADYVEEVERRQRAAQAKIISTIDAAFEAQSEAPPP